MSVISNLFELNLTFNQSRSLSLQNQQREIEKKKGEEKVSHSRGRNCLIFMVSKKKLKQKRREEKTNSLIGTHKVRTNEERTDEDHQKEEEEEEPPTVKKNKKKKGRNIKSSFSCTSIFRCITSSSKGRHDRKHFSKL